MRVVIAEDLVLLRDGMARLLRFTLCGEFQRILPLQPLL